MALMIARRLLAMMPTLLIASVVVFTLIHLVPGDIAVTVAGQDATDEQLTAIRHELGLDQSLVAQYVTWFGEAVRGDLGSSLLTGESVGPSIARTLPVTLSIVLVALIFAFGIGLTAGIIAAYKANGTVDRVVTGLASLGVAMPNFWIALILVSVFALGMGVLPATGGVSIFSDPGQGLLHAILPGFAMGVVGAAEVARQTRSAMIVSLASDAIRTHRAKGLRERSIMIRALKNAAVPLITIGGLVLNSFLGATVVIEAVFGVSGLGGLILRSTLQKDYPVIQAVVLTMAVLVILANLLVDIAYRVVDPRIK